MIRTDLAPGTKVRLRPGLTWRDLEAIAIITTSVSEFKDGEFVAVGDVSWRGEPTVRVQWPHNSLPYWFPVSYLQLAAPCPRRHA